MGMLLNNQNLKNLKTTVKDWTVFRLNITVKVTLNLLTSLSTVTKFTSHALNSAEIKKLSVRWRQSGAGLHGGESFDAYINRYFCQHEIIRSVQSQDATVCTLSLFLHRQ